MIRSFSLLFSCAAALWDSNCCRSRLSLECPYSHEVSFTAGSFLSPLRKPESVSEELSQLVLLIFINMFNAPCSASRCVRACVCVHWLYKNVTVSVLTLSVCLSVHQRPSQPAPGQTSRWPTSTAPPTTAWAQEPWGDHCPVPPPPGTHQHTQHLLLLFMWQFISFNDCSQSIDWLRSKCFSKRETCAS